jgi:RimJ/RimL family protein N-acetyltransferase
MFYDLNEIYLRELQKNDLAGNWYKWFNDADITKFQDKRIYPNSYEKQLEYYNYLQSSKNDIVMAIIEKKSNLHIGNIGLHKIDFIHRRCEIGIVLGEKQFLGKGYGTKCIQAFSNYAFNVLNLHRITAIIMEQNLASIKAFEKSGFIQEGMLKEYFYKNGEYSDVLIMGKLK